MLRIDNKVKKIWGIFLLIFPHIKPSSITFFFPRIGALYNYLSILSFLLILFMIIRRRNVKINLTLLLIGTMELWATFTTLLNKSDSLYGNFLSLISAISIPLIIYYYSTDYMDELLSALFMNFEWLIYASLISIIVYYPNGMYISGSKIQYFLGNENGIIFYVIPTMYLALIYMKKENRKLRGILAILACVANEVIVWCATGILGIAVAAVVMFLSFIKKKSINYYLIIIISLIADVMVTVLRLFDRYWLSLYLIESVFSKSLTFTGRTYIWDNAISLIKSHLLFGLGRGDHVMLRGIAYHAHNQYFQVLLVGGIPLLVIFIYLLFNLGKKLNGNSNLMFANIVSIAMMTCLLIQFIATSRLTFRLYVPLVLASYANEIDAFIETKIIERNGAELI